MIVICPECGSAMVLKETIKYRYPNNKQPRKFYGCSTWPICKATHGAHPNGEPLGTPGNKATKAARIKAHEAFDTLWRGSEISKKDAYKLMQDLMEMTSEQAHISKFDIEQCEALIQRIEEWRVEVKN